MQVVTSLTVRVVFLEGITWCCSVDLDDHAPDVKIPLPRAGTIDGVSLSIRNGPSCTCRELFGVPVLTDDVLLIEPTPNGIRTSVIRTPATPAQDGATCKRCKRHNEYAAPSSTYLCYECRC